MKCHLAAKHGHHDEVGAVRGKGAVVTLGMTRWMCLWWLSPVLALALYLQKRVVKF